MDREQEIKLKSAIKYASLYFGYALKSIWYATYNIASLAVYILLFGAIIFYLQINGNLNSYSIGFEFIKLIYLLFDYWSLFWLAFFGTKLYEQLRYL